MKQTAWLFSILGKSAQRGTSRRPYSAGPIWTCLVLVALSALPLHAQVSAASIKGTISDPSGLPIVGANVVVRNQSTELETQTVSNGAGAYEIANLDVTGVYTVTVNAPGFKSAESTNIRLVTGETTTLDLSLSLGAVTEKVTVSTKAERLDTASAASGLTTTSEEIQSLPLQLGGAPR